MIFTCVTDTGRLVWRINDNNHLYFSSGQVSQVIPIADIFTLQLINVTGSVFISTTTAHNVSLDIDGINVTCTDSEIYADAAMRIDTIRISINSSTHDVQLH